MRKNIKSLVNIVSESLLIEEPIYEFGALQVPDQLEYANLRPFFCGKEYIGCDMRQGPGVDRVLDLHNIDLPDNTVGTFLCFDTLEHVEYPHKAIEEAYRVLKKDGILIISSVMNFPIHDYPFDYWRFTPEAFKSLLKPFASSFVGQAGLEVFPHTVVGIGFKGARPDTKKFDLLFKNWVSKQKYSPRFIIEQTIPPIGLQFILWCLHNLSPIFLTKFLKQLSKKL